MHENGSSAVQGWGPMAAVTAAEHRQCGCPTGATQRSLRVGLVCL